VSPTQRDPEQFSVLFVCTANQCRSPMAEHLLRAQLTEAGLSWSVSSAGLQAGAGQGMHPFAARVLESRGIDPGGWSSRRLEPQAVAEADLILTATEVHRSAVARLSPGAMSRTFTLLHFAYLIRSSRAMATVPVTDLGSSLIGQASSARGSLQPLAPESRDLADPMGRSFARFRKCATTIDRALLDVLTERPRGAQASS
jgi:protein-tyrosine-phosphatase